jgi:hypothetical protein
MRLLPKLYLLLSSLLFLVFVSCRISKYKHSNCDKVVLTEKLLNPILSNKQSLKFKATIDVLKNHLTGILIVKQTDSVATHFIFVTELGMKMFDFVYKDNRMQAAYVFEPLNKPKLIQSLMRNFENIFLLNCNNSNACSFQSKNHEPCLQVKNNKTIFFYKGRMTDSNDLKLKSQEVFYKKRCSSKINYTYQPIIDSVSREFIVNDYSQISCTQYGLFKIYIDLIAIQ